MEGGQFRLTQIKYIDFDPEDDGVSKSSDEGSSSQDSDDGLIGTEHYVEVGFDRSADEVKRIHTNTSLEKVSFENGGKLLWARSMPVLGSAARL